MSLHHVAIGTPRPAELSSFYQTIPGVIHAEEQAESEGPPRSVWLRAGEMIIMLERSSTVQSARALVFSVTAQDLNALRRFLKQWESDRTDFTAYFSDPDGNRLGFSAFPRTLADLGI